MSAAGFRWRRFLIGWCGVRDRERLFVEEYLRGWNANEAARRAGYGTPEKAAPRVLHRPSVQAAIRQRISEKAMSADEVLLRLAEMARGDMGDFLTDGGSINIAKAREAGKLHLVKSFTEAGDKSGARIELYDAQAALEKVGKALGLFKERVEFSGAARIVINWDGTDADRDSGDAASGAAGDP